MTRTNTDLSARRETVVSVLAEALIEAAALTHIPVRTSATGTAPDVAGGDLIFLRDRASLSTEGEKR